MKYLALGDSYTIGESVSESERFPVQLKVRLEQERGIVLEDPKIIAVTGWRTDELLRAIANANLEQDYDLVSLLIGVNNQYQGKDTKVYETEFEELLKVAIAHAKGKKAQVFVLSIPDYAFTPFSEGKDLEKISRELVVYNTINRRISEDYDTTYINITDLTQEGLKFPDFVAADGLHPSGKMYGLWVDRILQHYFYK